eukprot:6589312-Alexandrium_andersonii.AAC.2
MERRAGPGGGPQVGPPSGLVFSGYVDLSMRRRGCHAPAAGGRRGRRVRPRRRAATARGCH